MADDWQSIETSDLPFQPPQGGILGVPPSNISRSSGADDWADVSAPPFAQPSGRILGTAASQPSIGQMFLNDITSLPGKIYEGIKGAVTLPGDVYQGNAVVPQSANMPGGEDVSSIGRVIDLASLGVRPFEKNFGRLGAPSEAELKSAATTGYTQAENLPISFKPEAMDTLGQNIQAGLGIDPELAPKTFKVLGRLSDYDKPVTPQNLRTVQRSLGDLKNYSSDGTERLVAGRSLKAFNDYLENVDPDHLASGAPADAAQFSALVRDANGNYSAYKQSQDFTQRGENATYDAAAANSGMNLENNLRSQVKQILKNPKLQRGLDDDTLQALKDFNGGSRTANVMRLIGNLLGGGGGLAAFITGGAGHLLGIPPETLPGAGMALRSVGNRIAASKFGDIGSMIRANSPLAGQGGFFRQPSTLPKQIFRGGILGTVLPPRPNPNQDQ